MSEQRTIQDYTPEELFASWKTWKERAGQAQAAERLLRTEVARRWFPNPKEGANNTDIILDGVERRLTLTQPVDRKVDEAKFRALQAELVGLRALQGVEGQEASRHPLYGTNLDKLIRQKPELATKEYRDLTDAERAYFETVLVIKDGSPQVELKPLKES